MSNWSWSSGKADSWIKAKLKDGSYKAFRMSGIKYLTSYSGGCEVTMNDGEVFIVNEDIHKFFDFMAKPV